MLAITYQEAKRLAQLIFNDEECFCITMNGQRTGTWPQRTHTQIYLFPNREEKVLFYARVTEQLALEIKNRRAD